VRIAGAFVLNQQFASTEAVIAAGNYAGGHDSYISSETYPLREGKQEKGRVLVTLDFSGWSRNPSTKEVQDAAVALGAQVPDYEDGLRLGAEYPKESYQRPFVALHEPGAQGGVLCLNRWYGERRLYRSVGGPVSRWDRDHYLFVFALPRVSG